MSTIGVTFSPPTPNGDFHLGHLAGPVLGADVYARARRRDGHRTRLVSSTDDNQTYVVTTAERLGTSPHRLIETAFAQGSHTLARAGVATDLYTRTDADYTRHVRAEFTALKELGMFEPRVLALPLDPGDQRIRTEAFVTGYCPRCVAAARAGSCEVCYRYNTPGELLTDTVHESVEATVWVLDLERHRRDLEQWYDSTAVLTRPVLRELFEEVMSGPLPCVPVTYPIAWGIETGWGPGPQRINAWPEITVGHTYWLRRAFGSDTTLDVLTQYMGVDNGFYNVFVYPVIQMGLVRAGRVPTAEKVVTVANHYLQLSGRKFSTSKAHVVWAADYLDTAADTDAARCALALLSPEQQETNFTPELAASLLTQEINPRLRFVRELAASARPDQHSPRWDRRLDAAAERYQRAYALWTPSIRTAAKQILDDIDYLRSLAPISTPAESAALLSGLIPWWEPILPGLAADLAVGSSRTPSDHDSVIAKELLL